MRKSMLTAALVSAALAAAACGSSSKTTTTHATSPSSTTTTSTSSSSSSAAGNITITTRTIKPYGAVLVNGAGHTLYIFAPDKDKKVTCVSACATIWPPVKLVSGAKPMASGEAKASLLGSDPNPSGGRVVTYSGWPLYTYVTDTAPGAAHGQALNSAGGLWYVISPTGKVIRSKPSSSSG